MPLLENPQTVEIVQLIADTGMCVILWLVQLVVYPGLLRIRADALTDWHAAYTFRVSFLIMPLMLTQIGLAVYSVLTAPSAFNGLYLFLILITWGLTFSVSVPLHNKVARGEGTEAVLIRLIQTN